MASKKTLNMAIEAFKGAGVYWDNEAEQSCSHSNKKPAVKISSSLTGNKTHSKNRRSRSGSLDQQLQFNSKMSSTKLLRAKENKHEKIAPVNLNVEELEKVLSSHTFNSDKYTSNRSRTLGFGSASDLFQFNPHKHGLTFLDNAGLELIPERNVLNRNINISNSGSNTSVLTTYDINLRTWEENEHKLTTLRHHTDRATSHRQLMSSQTEVFKVSEVPPDIVEFFDKENEIFFKDLILYQRSMLSGYLSEKQLTEPDSEVTSTIESSTSKTSTISKPFLTVKDSRTLANSSTKSKIRLRTSSQNDFSVMSRSISVNSGKSKKSSNLKKRNVVFQ